MAEKRMFSKQVVCTDSFLDMPLSSQCLYFHLSLQADDKYGVAYLFMLDFYLMSLQILDLFQSLKSL